MSNPIKTTQLTVIVTIKVAPENVKPFLEALRVAWGGCIKEPENVFFDVFQDPANPGSFQFVECWTKDEKWFKEVQMKRDYYEPYTSITEPMWLEPRQIKVYERVEGWSYADEEYLAGRVNT